MEKYFQSQASKFISYKYLPTKMFIRVQDSLVLSSVCHIRRHRKRHKRQKYVLLSFRTSAQQRPYFCLLKGYFCLLDRKPPPLKDKTFYCTMLLIRQGVVVMRCSSSARLSYSHPSCTHERTRDLFFDNQTMHMNQTQS